MASSDSHPGSAITISDPEDRWETGTSSGVTPPVKILDKILLDSGQAQSKEKTIPAPLPENERSIRGFKWFLVSLAIFSANILYGLDNTIVADIQADISETYGNVAQLGWLGVGFTLGSSVFILPLGKAYSLFDTKWVLIGCLANFTAGSALCGAAPTMDAMIAGRVWAGAGGAGMYLGTLNLCTALCTPKEQPIFVAMTGFWYGVGCILGPVVGGAFADSDATWRWGFYINLCIFAAMIPIYIFLLPSVPKNPDLPVLERTRNLDWLGILLTASLFGCFTVAFTSVGVAWEWDDGRTIALIVVFGACAVALGVTQYFAILTSEENRLFPCDLLQDPQLVLLYIIMSCSGAALLAAIYYIPLYHLFVYGSTGTEAATRLLPYIFSYVFSVLTCGAVMSRVGYPAVWFLASGMLLTAGAAAMHTVTMNTSHGAIAGFTVLVGLGMTTCQAPYSVGNALVRSSRDSDLIQFINISQGSSQLISLALASAIFQGATLDGMRRVLGPDYADWEIQAAIAGARSDVLAKATPEVHAQAIDVIIGGISRVWTIVIAAGALSTICSLFLTRSRFLTKVNE